MSTADTAILLLAIGATVVDHLLIRRLMAQKRAFADEWSCTMSEDEGRQHRRFLPIFDAVTAHGFDLFALETGWRIVLGDEEEL